MTVSSSDTDSSDTDQGWTSKRGRVAALSRSRGADDPDLLEARRALREARLADYIRKTVDAAPPLTAEQRERLAVLLLRGGDPPGGGSATQTFPGVNRAGGPNLRAPGERAPQAELGVLGGHPPGATGASARPRGKSRGSVTASREPRPGGAPEADSPAHLSVRTLAPEVGGPDAA